MSSSRNGTRFSSRMSTGAKFAVFFVLLALAASFVGLSRINTEGGGNILVLTLVNINLILVVALALLLSRNLLKWMFGGRHLFASLQGRLVAAFLGFSLVPSVLLFVVASGLLTDSVDGWFSPQVEGALKDAVQVARDRYKDMHEGVAVDARRAGDALAAPGPPIGARAAEAVRGRLETVHETWGFSGLTLHYGDSFGDSVTVGEVALLDPPYGQETTRTLPAPDGERVQAGVPVADWGYLVVERPIPASRITELRRITEDFENFSQLAAFKEPIKEGYKLSFLVITLVILFSATWFGFYMARTITTPVQQLLEGTREVASGNLDVQLSRGSQDELGLLVDAFNAMTAQLAASKAQLTTANISLTESNKELAARRAHMEAILENAATGVIAIEPGGRVSLFNRAAADVIGLDPAKVTGKPYREAFRDISPQVISQLTELLRAEGGEPDREVTFTRNGKTHTLQVHARRVERKEGESLGLVLVFDDLTELIQGQKEAAWREVAQRIAHEIKNPLTPIQLSVQRLRKRFSKGGELLPPVVEETTTTILEEVGGLKRLVDEFSQFARMPPPILSTQPVWDLVGEVVGLYRQAYPAVDLICEDADLGEISIDREQMRRVFTNLFENAMQAMDGNGSIRISGSRNNGEVVIRVADSGPGVPREDQDEVFRPYYSKREGGTGLGLAIAARIIDEHGGRISVSDNDPHGAVFSITLPVA
ncbi:MAG: ATP-binding protein [Leptospirillia bacterium]